MNFEMKHENLPRTNGIFHEAISGGPVGAGPAVVSGDDGRVAYAERPREIFCHLVHTRVGRFAPSTYGCDDTFLFVINFVIKKKKI